MRYRSIDVRIWGDEKFRSLSSLQPSGQALFLYLLTNPNTTMIPGLYRAGPAAMAEELEWAIEDFREAFDELTKQDLVKADIKARVIFIPNAIKYNKPQSPNVVIGWALHWDEIPECNLKTLVYQNLKAFVEGIGEAFGLAFNKAIRKPYSKIIPNQEQDKEQFQELSFNVEQLTVHDRLPLKGSKIKGVISNLESQVFIHWQTVMKHPQAKLDGKRIKKIEAAFKLGFNLEQLKYAIDGCANTPFNMGENANKQRYDSIDLIFRDAEHIERFIRNAGGNEMEHAVSQIDQISEGAI